MFTRPMHEPDSTYQHELLERVSELVDGGTIRAPESVLLYGSRQHDPAHPSPRRVTHVALQVGKVSNC
jgi:hypothetical protein